MSQHCHGQGRPDALIVNDRGVNDELSLRLTTKEVCALGRFSTVTLWRRIKSGQMPPPIDRCRQSVFDREAVMAALRPAVRPTDEPEGDRIIELIAARSAYLAQRRRSK